MERQHRNEITAFVVGGKIFRVIATSHGMAQMKARNLDEFHVASACLALGEKLIEYNDSGKNIMLVDDGKKLSTVVAIENYTIVLITVIDKGNEVRCKHNTVREDCNLKQKQLA